MLRLGGYAGVGAESEGLGAVMVMGVVALGLGMSRASKVLSYPAFLEL